MAIEYNRHSLNVGTANEMKAKHLKLIVIGLGIAMVPALWVFDMTALAKERCRIQNNMWIATHAAQASREFHAEQGQWPQNLNQLANMPSFTEVTGELAQAILVGTVIYSPYRPELGYGTMSFTHPKELINNRIHRFSNEYHWRFAVTGSVYQKSENE